MRLRMICQSWKVMFQAEYSSGSPLRMLVDLRASIETALGRGKSEPEKAKTAPAAKPAAKSAPAVPDPKPAKAAAAAAPSGQPVPKPAAKPVTAAQPKPAPQADAPEFEISSGSDWDGDSSGKK